MRDLDARYSAIFELFLEQMTTNPASTRKTYLKGLKASFISLFPSEILKY